MFTLLIHLTALLGRPLELLPLDIERPPESTAFGPLLIIIPVVLVIMIAIIFTRRAKRKHK